MTNNTKAVGRGDKNFAAWTVHYGEDRKPEFVDIPRSTMSGHMTYAVDLQLGQMIEALERGDQSKDAPWDGRCADAIARIDRSLEGRAHHSDPALNTTKIVGSNHVVSKLHDALFARGLVTVLRNEGKNSARRGMRPKLNS